MVGVGVGVGVLGVLSCGASGRAVWMQHSSVVGGYTLQLRHKAMLVNQSPPVQSSVFVSLVSARQVNRG